jgi:hypothetical protein
MPTYMPVLLKVDCACTPVLAKMANASSDARG